MVGNDELQLSGLARIRFWAFITKERISLQLDFFIPLDQLRETHHVQKTKVPT